MQTPRLERWLVYGNCLVGYIFDSKQFKPGTRVLTDAIRPGTRVLTDAAECLDGAYRLGEPGSYQEHDIPLVGRNFG